MTYNELFIQVKNYLQNDFPDNVWTDVAGTGTTTSTGTEQINSFIKQAEERIYNTVQIPPLRNIVTGVTTVGNKYVSCPSDFMSVFSMAVIDVADNYEYLLNKDVNFIREAYPNPNDQAIPKYYALFGPTVTNGVPSPELSFILGPTPDLQYDIELHYYAYPESIVQRPLIGVSITTAGSGFDNGLYFNVPLFGGSGSGATATVTVSGGTITSVDIASSGAGYAVGDVLTVDSFATATVTVVSVGNLSGTSWLGDNYDPVLLYGTLVEAYTFMKGEADLIGLYDGKFKEAMSQLNRLGTGLERGDAYRDGQAKIKVMP